MHRFIQLLAIAVGASLAAAQDRQPIVTSLLLPYNDPNPFVATVMGVDASATTYAYTCASSISPDDCGMGTHGTVVQGPSTWQLTLSESDTDGVYALTAACTLTPSKFEASCTISETQSDSETQTRTSKVGVMTGYNTELQAVTLVAGLDKLTDGAVPSATTASSPSSGASSTSASSTGGASSPSPSASSSSRAASSSAASSASGTKTGTTNAAPAATQQALLAGVAAVVGALAF